MPIYLRQETEERPMHDQDPSDSPRLAEADLTEVAGMMRGLSALAVKRGRPLPLISQCCEWVSILVATDLPFDEWTQVLGSERLTGVLLERLHPPRAHPGDERRELPPQAQPGDPPHIRQKNRTTHNAPSMLPFPTPVTSPLRPICC